MKKEDWKFLAELAWRVICSAIFFSFIGYAFSESWWFWKWNWAGICVFFVLLVFVVLIAIEEEIDRQIEEHRNKEKN